MAARRRSSVFSLRGEVHAALIANEAFEADVERGVDGLLLVGNDGDRRLRHARRLERRRLDARHLIGFALAQIVVAAADVVIEASRYRARDRDEILIATVTGP